MIDKKELKSQYKQSEKVGALVDYHNKSKDKHYLDIAQDLAGIKNRFEFAKSTGNGVPLKIDRDFKSDEFELIILEELKMGETQTAKEFKADLLTLKEIWLEKFADKDIY